MAYIKLMEYEWSENPREVAYYVPDGWNVKVHHIAGFRKPELLPRQIAQAISTPSGSKTITELARGKNKVCILFDDLTRGTPAYRIIPHVLTELKAGGVNDDRIEFICAVGLHGPWDRVALARKVGEDVMQRYQVYNHSAFTNCVSLGKTSFGTRVEVNSEVMSCDLKIAISNVVPHPTYGFGGGGKIVMPGISSYESICDHHLVVHAPQLPCPVDPPDPKGMIDGNTQPVDAMEFARMAGIDFSINCLLREKDGDVVSIFAGDVSEAFNQAVAAAREHYKVAYTVDNDIVIANTFCKANEAGIATGSAFMSVRRSGGTAVIMANSHLGQVVHYLMGNWGLTARGRGMGIGTVVPPWVKHCVWYCEFPEARTWASWNSGDLSRVTQPDDWAEVIGKLIEWHGFKAKVAVFPDATNQYMPPLKA